MADKRLSVMTMLDQTQYGTVYRNGHMKNVSKSAWVADAVVIKGLLTDYPGQFKLVKVDMGGNYTPINIDPMSGLSLPLVFSGKDNAIVRVDIRS